MVSLVLLAMAFSQMNSGVGNYFLVALVMLCVCCQQASADECQDKCGLTCNALQECETTYTECRCKLGTLGILLIIGALVVFCGGGGVCAKRNMSDGGSGEIRVVERIIVREK